MMRIDFLGEGNNRGHKAYRCENETAAKPKHHTAVTKHVKVAAGNMKRVVRQDQLQGSLSDRERQRYEGCGE